MSEPIRILHAGLTDNLGGVESFVMNIYRKIDRSKVQFDFLVEHSKRLPFEEEIEALGGRIYHEYYFMRSRNEESAVTVKDFFDRHPEFAGVHLHANGLNTLFRVLMEAKRHHIPIRVLHSHNNGYMYHYNIKQKLYERYVKTVMGKYVTDYFACSKEAGEWMFGNNKPFSVIQNAIDLEKFAYNEETCNRIRAELGIEDNQKLIGFAGSFNYQKDPLSLIDIFKEVYQKDASYRLVMLGKGKLFDAVQEKIGEYGFKEAVHCVGSKSNVHEYMQAMDLFLLPSRFEGFGIVLLEAQAAGMPCVTSKDVVSKSADITGNVQFVSKELAPTAWADAVLKTEIKRYDAKALFQNSDYNIDKLVKKMEDFYEELLDG